MRAYHIELLTADDERLSENVSASNFVEASEYARTWCAAEVPGTRIVMVIEADEVTKIIQEARMGR